MRNYKHYIKYEKESKVFAAVLAFILLIMIAVFILAVIGIFETAMWKPDVEYPMVNTHVEWMPKLIGGAF